MVRIDAKKTELEKVKQELDVIVKELRNVETKDWELDTHQAPPARQA
jgi:uncharacterized coiled-coil protein SlyX